MAVEVYENILTEDQVEEISSLRTDANRITYFGEHNKQIITHLKDFFGQFDVRPFRTGGRYFFAKHPYAVHSDGLSAKGGEQPVNTTVIVPLKWGPPSASTHTVFFDQFNEEPMHGKQFFAHTTRAKNNIGFETTADGITNMTDQPFNREIYDEHLSYMDYDDLRGLTHNTITEWKRGDAIKFESNRLHCSSDFVAHGLRFKLYLFFKFNIPE